MAKILLVDDDKFSRVIAQKILEPEHEVTTVSLAAGAADMLAEGRFDLLLLDVMMPEINGYEVLEMLTAAGLRDRIGVIFITSRGNPDDIEKGLASGADDYIIKPFSPAELRARVRLRLEQRIAAKSRAGIFAEETKRRILSVLPVITECSRQMRLRQDAEGNERTISACVSRIENILARDGRSAPGNHADSRD